MNSIGIIGGLYMYISDTLKEVLKDMLQESDYYFVLAELNCAYDDGYRNGYSDGYDDGYGLQFKEEH